MYHAGPDSLGKTGLLPLCVPRSNWWWGWKIIASRHRGHTEMSGSAVIDRHPELSHSTGSTPSPVLLPSVPGQDSRAPLGAQDHTHRVHPASSEAAQSPQLRAPAHLRSQGWSPTPAAGTTDSQADRDTHRGWEVPCWKALRSRLY